MRSYPPFVSELVSPHPPLSGPVGDKVVTREPATEELFSEGNVLTAPNNADSALLSPDGPETAPETTLETVSASYSASEKGYSSSSAPRQRHTPSFVRRLPRFRRAKSSHRPPLALQPRDEDLLRTIHDYRLISTPQILRLLSDESRDALYRRLQKLFHHGYVDRLGTNPNAPMIYALARRGGDVLGVSARKEPGDRYIAHQLMIGDVRAALTLACRMAGFELSWRAVPPDAPVRPDGFFGLRFPTLPEGRNRAFFFLEADRSTMSRERFLDKLRAYQAWSDAGAHTAALGIKAFRVLTVTKSRERRATLLAAVREDGELQSSRQVWWFGVAQAVLGERPEAILGAIWESSVEPARPVTLLPPGLAPFPA